MLRSFARGLSAVRSVKSVLIPQRASLSQGVRSIHTTQRWSKPCADASNEVLRARFSVSRRFYALPAAHGGKLINLVASGSKLEQLKKEAVSLPTLRLNQRHLCDVELLLNGAFSPLRGFMGQEDYECVCTNMRLKDGTLFPLPITLDLSEEMGAKLRVGQRITLIDSESDSIAIMTIRSLWRPDRERESDLTFGTRELGHAGAQYLLEQSGPIYVSLLVLRVMRTHRSLTPRSAASSTDCSCRRTTTTRRCATRPASCASCSTRTAGTRSSHFRRAIQVDSGVCVLACACDCVVRAHSASRASRAHRARRRAGGSEFESSRCCWWM
jgi:hypothetical protein